MEIVDEDISVFVDDPLTNDVDEKETLGVEFLNIGSNEDATKVFIYVKYDNKAYKIVCDYSIANTEINTEKLELVYTPKGNEGRVTDDGWTILYDNGETVEAVSPKAMGKLKLGISNASRVSEETLKKTIDLYNIAIDKINEYCQELENLPANSGVRSVGGSSETNEYYKKIPLEWQTSEYNGKIKSGDELYEQDFVRMSYWEKIDVGETYWVASRCCAQSFDNEPRIYFSVCRIWSRWNVRQVRRVWTSSRLWTM